MDSKHLHEQLHHLQTEIDGLPVQEGERAKLLALVEDIDRELGAESKAALQDAGLHERIDEMVSSFEVDHPTVAGILKDIMVKLASIGV
jgi:hypothetical protein